MENNNDTIRRESDSDSLSLNKKCIICGKELVGNQKKYCSPHCADRSNYNKNKSRYLAYCKQWQKDNEEKVKRYHKISMERYKANGKMNSIMKKQYRNNKDRWNCRSQTNKYVRTGIVKIEKICKVCGEPGDKLRFEEYKVGKENILNAISEGKIYYLCNKHHRESVNRMRWIK
jgi:hypothetical protein